MNDDLQLTQEELRLAKIAVTRAMDAIRANEMELYGQFEKLYARLRELGA